MNSTQNNNQSGQGSRNDDSTRQDSRQPETQKAGKQAADNDDDFLSGDNAKKVYPNNQNNPSRGYQASPGKNPNIGGNESEYETSTPDADQYEEDTLANNEEPIVNRRDSEEIDRHDDETRYSSPRSGNSSDE